MPTVDEVRFRAGKQSRDSAFKSVCGANAGKPGACTSVFILLEGESFRMGTFGRLVLCGVRTQIVGQTKFFDSLEKYVCPKERNMIY